MSQVLDRRRAEYPTIRVEGTARERGLTYGRLARERVGLTLEAYSRLFTHYAGLDWNDVTDYARSYEPIVLDFDRSLIEEMHGIAEGAGVDFKDILAINVRTEVMYGLGELHAAECSAFAALPEAVANGHTLLGQNWDWHPAALNCCVVLCIRQEDRPSILTVVEAGLLAKMGMNSDGLGVATNALVSDIDRGEPGIPFHVMLRSILNSRTLEEAVKAVQTAHRASSANYLIAAAGGSAIDLETAPGGSDHVFSIEPIDGVLGHANCFIAPDVTITDETERLKPMAKIRQRTIESHLRSAWDGIDAEYMRHALTDHENHPHSMCRHPLEEAAPMERSATVASVVMDLDDRTMWVSDGQPCTHPYREISASSVWDNRSAAS
jgi:isopenicillin-N N-acyltransferase like protein